MLNERIDEGGILLQRTTPITPDDNAETLHDRLASMGSQLVVETLRGLQQGTLHPKPQPIVTELNLAPKIFKPDCAINWNQQGRRVVDFIRGLSPYPAATMLMEDDKGQEHSFKVFQASFQSDVNSAVGQLVTEKKSVLKIGVKDGFLHVLSLQLSGKKRITAEEFLRGHDVKNWRIIV
jgi:methionyl-tRNA formyltransferase